MKRKPLITVEVTESYIKALGALPARKGAIVTFASVEDARQKSDAEISALLAKTMGAMKQKNADIVVSVPRRLTILRQISLPSHAESEIAKMVGLQVIQQIPYPREDVILDYIVLNKAPSGYTRILAIAVHKEVISRYLKIFQDSGFPLNKITLSSSGIVSWHNYQDKKNHFKRDQPVGVINIDDESTEMCFSHNQKLLFSRNINFGARDLNSENINAFAGQIGLTIMTYVKEKIGGEINRFYIVSSRPEAVLLKERIEAEYKTTVEIMGSMDNILKKRTLRIDQLLKEKGISLAVNLGLALAERRKLVNLLPADIADTRKSQQRQKAWVKFIVLFVLAFGLSTGTLGVHYYQNTLYLSELESAIARIKPKVEKVKEILKRMSFVRERLNPRVSTLDILMELQQLTPVEISYNNLYIDENRSLTLQGISQVGASVNILQGNLVNSPFFENVTLQYVTKRKVFRGELTDFKITCQVKKE